MGVRNRGDKCHQMTGSSLKLDCLHAELAAMGSASSLENFSPCQNAQHALPGASRRICLAWILQSRYSLEIAMERNILIIINDCQRLTGLIEFASPSVKIPEIVNHLHGKFNFAKMHMYVDREPGWSVSGERSF